jgi:Leucine-rich repeat (LRR) protein
LCSLLSSHLALSMNNLSSLPDSVGSLATLKHLEVSDNRLQVLPVSIGETREHRGSRVLLLLLCCVEA